MKPDPLQETWSIEADASLQSVLDDAGCPSLLRRALTGALSWQTRNETSVRRALTAPRIAPQWVAALLALGATVTVKGDDGPTEVPLAKMGSSRPHALHVGPGGVKWGAAHVGRTPADTPIVAAVAGVEVAGGVVQQARVALTGVWPEPVRLAEAPAQLVGRPLDETSIQAVAGAVEKEVAPQGDFRGSEEYRRAMAGVLTRRALEACLCEETGDE